MKRLTKGWHRHRSRSSGPPPAESGVGDAQQAAQPPRHDGKFAGRPKQATPGPAASPCPADESAELWKRAYDLLYEENPEIMKDAEAVLKDQADIPQQANMQDRLADVAAAQKKKFENKQWKVQWLGKPQVVREKIESVMEHANQWSGLISVGMSYAPPYVSVPWSAATALLPMMMNEFKEHQGAVGGLESITKLVLSYQLAERVFLGRDEATRETYATAVIDFYKKILEYQTRAIQYFGRSTLKRLGRNVMGSTLWADMPGVLAGMDNDVRRSLDFISMDDQASGFSSLKDILERQEEKIDTLVESALANSEEVKDIVNWVSGIPIENDHADVRQKLGEGHYTSGRWFLDDPQVAAWMGWDPGCRSLWLRGGMGTGKSSLTSILIEELVRSPDGTVAFFYCSKKIDEKAQKSMQRNNVDNVLRSLLAQSAVSTDGRSVSDGVKKRYTRDKRRVLSGFALGSNDCLMILSELISRQPDTHFTVVVDALDECEDYDALLALLQSVSTAENIRFFFSSRLDVRVDSVFDDASAITILSQNCGDIERFLNVEVPRRRDGCGITDPQVDKLKEILLGRANGMFLWVKIQVNRFLHPIKSPRTRLESDIALRLSALEDFSAVGEELLYAAYDDEYDRATGFGAEPGRLAAVVSALRWVLSAYRPLSLRELAYAVAVNHQDGTPTRGVQEGDLLEFCSNLLVEDSTGIMQLAHLSVRNYLEARQPPDFVPEKAHLEAALTSLYFMRSPSYDELAFKGSDVIQQGGVALTRGFYEYVTTYWSSHCRKAPDSQAIMETLGPLHVPPPGGAATSNVAEAEGGGEGVSKLGTDATADADDVSGHGTEDAGDRDIACPPETKTAGDRDSVPGSAAEAASPEKHIVSDLFDRITDLLERGEPTLADFLAQRIARNTDLSSPDKLGDTTLHHVARLREEGGMNLLLRAEAPVNAQNNVGNTPLHVAAMYRFDEGARQLLVAGADRNARNKRGETALHLAIIHESRAVFETLLSAGVDVLAQDHRRNTPFHYAAQWESSDAVKSLLYEGYSPDSTNEAGDTALSIAIKSSNKDMVKELIRHGATVRAEDTAAAASRGLEELVTASPDELQPGMGSALPSGAAFKVEISEAPPSCQYCNPERWLSSRRGTPHPHWPSFNQLRGSAAMCSLCAFFEKEILESHPDGIESATGRLLVTVELASDRPWEKSGKDTLTLSIGEATTFTWELCFDALHNQAADADIPLLTGRLIDPDPAPQTTFALAQDWLSDCMSTHEACMGGTDGTSPVTPTRLVDIGSGELFDDMRVIETDGRTIQFAYLSYSWGGSLPKSQLTTRNRGEMLSRTLSREDFTPTVADAMTIVHSCGLRYIWVDALCIMQDTPEEWTCEILRMPEYIQSATFVLSAASSKDAAQGLFRERAPSLLRLGTASFVQRRLPPVDGAPGAVKCGLHLRKVLQSGAETFRETMLARCWLIQELILPRRLLVWGADQVHWTCRTCLWSEGSTASGDPDWVKYLPPPEGSSASPNGVARSHLTWYSLVELYSRGRLTYSGDRLKAVQAFKVQFVRRAIRAEYAAGLWVDDFANGLLWYSGEGARLARSHAPSWSWASIDGPVTYSLLRGTRADKISNKDHRVSFVEATCDKGEGGIGSIRGDADPGYVKLDALTLDGLDSRDEACRQQLLECEYFFDSAEYERRFHNGGEWAGGRLMLMFVTPWYAGSVGPVSAGDMRCAGLVLFDPGMSGDSPAVLTRLGLFLGLRYDGALNGWARRTVLIR